MRPPPLPDGSKNLEGAEMKDFRRLFALPRKIAQLRLCFTINTYTIGPGKVESDINQIFFGNKFIQGSLHDLRCEIKLMLISRQSEVI